MTASPSLIRFANANVLHPDGRLVPGYVTVDPLSGTIVDVEPDDGEEKIDDGSVADAMYRSPNDDDGSFSSMKVHEMDCRGRILSPGYVDLQLNGAYGIDFSDPRLSLDDVKTVARGLLRNGVTSFCPTMISCSSECYRRVLPVLRASVCRDDEGPNNDDEGCGDGCDEKDEEDFAAAAAAVLGMHLEGPFFASSKRGAHPAENIRDPIDGLKTIQEVYGLGLNDDSPSSSSDSSCTDGIAIVTLAPELPGGLDAVRSLSDRGVVVSCGHTESTHGTGHEAMRCGATLLTHLYNAMNPFHHREPGLVGLLAPTPPPLPSPLQGAAAAVDRCGGSHRPYYSLIVDNIHVHPAAVSLARQTHPDGLVLVSDAMSATGLGDGLHTLGSTAVQIHNGRATVLPDGDGDGASTGGKGTLAGSVATMDECVRNLRSAAGCSPGEALLAATLRPVEVLLGKSAGGRRSRSVPPTATNLAASRRGKIEVGCRADLLLLDGELRVLETWVGGRRAFRAKDEDGVVGVE